MVREGLDCLPGREARVLKLRAGIGFPAMSARKVARHLGLSQATVYRIFLRGTALPKEVIEGRRALVA